MTPNNTPPRVAAVVLAAGRSRRMGGPNKLLASVGGRAVVRCSVETALAGGLDPVIVVTGEQAEQVLAALAGLPVRPVHNPEAHLGMSTSIAAGIRAVGPVDGVAIVLGDMPWVTPADIAALLAAFALRRSTGICVPVAGHRRGNPVIWASHYFGEFGRLIGDVGARALLARHSESVHEVLVLGTGVLRDVDVPEDLVGPSP